MRLSIQRLLPVFAVLSTIAIPVAYSAHNDKTVDASLIHRNIQNGQDELATQQAADKFTEWANSLLKYAKNGRYDHEAAQLAQNLRQHELIDDVISLVRPADTDVEVEWLRFAIICEYLGDNKQAVDTYEQLLKNTPNAPKLLVPMAFIVAESDIDKAVECLKSVDPQDMQTAERLLVDRVMSRPKFDVAAFASQYDLIIAWLASNSETDTVGTYATRLFNHITYIFSHNKQSVPRLFELEVTVDEELVDFAKTRRRIFDDLCQVLLKSPNRAVRTQAFLYCQSMVRVAKEDMAQLVPLAESLVLATPTPKTNYNTTADYLRNAPGDMQRLYGPAEFLVRHAWNTENADAIRARIIPTLKENDQVTDAKHLEALTTLYLANADTFGEAITQYLQQPEVQGDAVPLVIAIDAWVDREIKTPITDELIKGIKTSPSFPRTTAAAGHLSAYAKKLAEYHGREAATAFFETLADEFIGPADTRAENLSKIHNLSRDDPRKAHLTFYNRAMETAAHNEMFFFEAIERLAYPKKVGPGDRRFDDAFSWILKKGRKHPEVLLTLLENSPWLGDLNDFRVFPAMSREKKQSTLLCNLVNDVRFNKERRQKTQAWCQNQPNQTFGVKLIQAMISNDILSEGICQALGEHLDELRSADDHIRETFALLIKSAGYPPTRIDGLALEAYTLVNQKETSQKLTEIAAFLSIDSVNNLPFASSKLEEKTAEMLAAAVMIDYAKAMHILNKSIALHNELVSTGKTQPSTHGPGAYAGKLLDQAMRANPSPQMKGFFVLAIRDSIAPPINYTGYNGRNPLTPTITPQDTNVIQKLDTWSSALTPFLPDGDLSYLHPILFELIQGHERHQAKFREWAVGSTTDPDNRIRQAMKDLFELRVLNKSDDKPSDTTALEADYRNTLADQSISSTVKLSLAHLICGNLKNEFEHRLDMLMTKALIQAYSNDDAFVPGATGSMIMERFNKLKRSDEWYKTADDLTYAYLLHRDVVFLRTSKPRRNPYVGNHYRRFSVSPPEIEVMKLMLELEYSPYVEELLADKHLNMEEQFDTWITLIRYGQYDKAKHLIEEYAQHPDALRTPTTTFDESLAKNLPAFLATIERQDVRFMAEAMLNAVRDPYHYGSSRKTENQTTVPRRGDRLSAIAARFPEIEFENDAIKNQSLLSLLEEHASHKPLHQMLIDITKDLDIEEVINSKDKIAKKWLQHRYRADLMNHEPTAFIAAYDKAWSLYEAAINAGKDRNTTNPLRSFVGGLNEAFEDTVLKRPNEFSLDELKTLCPLIRKTIGFGDSNNLIYQYHNLNVAIHLVTDQMAEYQQWREQLSDQQLRTYQSQIRFYFWPKVISLIGDRDQVSVEKRLTLVHRVLETPCLHDWATWHGRRGGALFNGPILTDEEWLEHGPAICEAYPADGVMWSHLARVAHTVNNHPLRDEYMAKALEYEPHGWSAFYVAQTLLKFRRFEEAEQMASSIQADKDRSLKGSLKSLQKHIERERNKER